MENKCSKNGCPPQGCANWKKCDLIDWTVENIETKAPSSYVLQTLKSFDLTQQECVEIIREAHKRLPDSKKQKPEENPPSKVETKDNSVNSNSKNKMKKSKKSKKENLYRDPGNLNGIKGYPFFTRFAKKIQVQDDALDIFMIDNFMTEAQCKDAITLGERHLEPSPVTAYGEGNVIDEDDRRSETAFITRQPNLNFSKDEMLFLMSIENKACLALGVHPDRCEGIQMQKYSKGDYFYCHFDGWDTRERGGQEFASPEEGGNRVYSFMVYLNEPKKGGSTKFWNVKDEKGKILKIKPKIGTAVFWKNIDENGFPLESSHHEGTTIKKGLKYILTIWIREASEDREVINVYGPRTMSIPRDSE